MWSCQFAVGILFLCALTSQLAGPRSLTACEPNKQGQRLDAFGDPLPTDCVARIGSSRLRHVGGTRDVAFAASDELLLSLGGDGVLVAWDASTGRRVWSSSQETGISSFAVARDANLLVTYESKRGIVIYLFDETRLTEQVVLVDESKPREVCVAISNDGQLCAASGLSGETVVWRSGSAGKWEKVMTAPIVVARGTRMIFSEDGRWLACSPSRRGGLVVIDVATAQFITDLTSDAIGEVTDFDFLPGSEAMLIAREQAKEYSIALLSDIQRRGKVTPFLSEKELHWIRADRDGKTFWTVARHEDLVRRTVERGEIVSRVRVQDKVYEKLPRAAFSADGSRIALPTNPVRLFEASSGRQLLANETAGPNRWSGIPLVDQEEKRLVLADSIWDLKSGDLIQRADVGSLLALSQSDVLSLVAKDGTLSIHSSGNNAPLAVRPLQSTRLTKLPAMTAPRHVPILTFHNGPKRTLSLDVIDTFAGNVRELWKFDDFEGEPVPSAAVQTATRSLSMAALLDDEDRIHLVSHGDSSRLRSLRWNRPAVRRGRLVLSLSDDGTRLAGFDVANAHITIWDTTSLQQVATMNVATAAQVLERARSAKEVRLSTTALGAWCAFTDDNALIYVFYSDLADTTPHLGNPLLVSSYDVVRGESAHLDRVVTTPEGMVQFLSSWESHPLLRPDNFRFVPGAEARIDGLDRINVLPGTIAVSSDGALCAYEAQHEIVLLEMASGQQVARINPGTERISALAFTPSNRFLVIRASDYLYSTFDVAATPKTHEDGPEPLEALWEKLASPDAETAHQAMWLVASRQDRAVAFLSGKLAPSPGRTANQRVEQLVADLTAAGFSQREKAWKELGLLGGEDHARLARQALKCDDPSVRRALGNLLSQSSPEIKHIELLRQLRAISSLARMTSPASRALLTKLASGDACDVVTARARLSLQSRAPSGQNVSQFPVRPIPKSQEQ